MKDIRKRIELGFESVARMLYRHRIKTLVLMALWFAALATQLPNLTLDTSTEGMLHANDPTLAKYNEFRDQFGRDDLILVAVNPHEVFELAFLEKLRALHEELEENLPYLDSVTSLVNARSTRGEGDELVVEDLMEEWPETEEHIAVLKQRVMDNPSYRNMLISEDGSFTTLAVQSQVYSGNESETDILAGFDEELEEPVSEKSRTVLTDGENSEIVEMVYEIVERYRADDFEVWVAGSPVISHALSTAMVHDMQKFNLLSLVIITLILFVMFRNLAGVCLSLIVIVCSVMSALSFMAFAGVPVKLPTQILPSFLLAVSVGASVHVLAMFFHHLRQSGDKEASVVYALGHSGLAIVMTSLTTAGGLLSFMTADLAPIVDLGLFAGLGGLCSLLYTVILLPALLAVTRINIQKIHAMKERETFTDRLMDSISHISTTYAKSILLITLIIIALSFQGALQIDFSHEPLKWFPESARVRTASETVDRELRGSFAVEAVIDTGSENGLYDPNLLNRLEKSTKDIEALHDGKIFIGKTMALDSILKETNQALHENRSEFYSIPQNRDLVAQELFLFENSGSDDLEDFVDSQFAQARLSMKTPFEDAIAYKGVFQQITQELEASFPDATITLTGMVTLLMRTVANVVSSMSKSYVVAMIVITGLMVLFIGHWRIGLLSMVPNLFPILLTLGIMGWFKIPMDLSTLLIGSIGIGLAVDDTIHFLHNFRRYYQESGDPKAAVYETLHTAGRAMLVATSVLSVGFFVLMFAQMKNIFNFGLLSGLTIFMALMADYFISPALMILVTRARRVEPDIAKSQKLELSS